jgi:hypothetical protein
MRPSLPIKGLVLFFVWILNLTVARASHVLGAELVYEHIGTAASPNRYRVSALAFNDSNSPGSEHCFCFNLRQKRVWEYSAGQFHHHAHAHS